MINTDSLASARFFATKTEPITGIDVIAEAPLERPELIKGKDAPGVLTFARVHRESGSDLYQLVVDKQGNDILGQEDTAFAAGKQLSNGYAAGSGVLHKLTDPAMLRGRTPAQALRDEKRREDRLRATGPRVVRWGHEDLTLPRLGTIQSGAGLRPLR